MGHGLIQDVIYYIFYHIFETKSINNNKLQHNKLQMKIDKFTIVKKKIQNQNNSWIKRSLKQFYFLKNKFQNLFIYFFKSNSK